MRIALLFLFISIFSTKIFSQTNCKGKRITIIPTADHGRYLVGSSFNYSPGDTLVLKSKYNNWSYFTMINFHGTRSCPLVIINQGRVKFNSSGIELTNCTYVKVSGAGDPKHFYGFYFDAVKGPAINVNGRSAFVEIERLQGYKTFGGAWLKQDPDCDTKLDAGEVTGSTSKMFKGSWHMDHISIHDCKFTNIPFDVIYAGNTAPNGGRDITCNGETKNYIPMRLSNCTIYNNIIDSATRTGIQLSGADSGTNKIYNNVIRRVGFEYNISQGYGIIIGTSTKNAEVYGNHITQTYNCGIFISGSLTNKIHDNIIDSSGYLNGSQNQGITAIIANNNPSFPADSSTLRIKNNKIGLTTNSDQIIIYEGFPKPALPYTSNNIICNNTRLDGGTIKMYIDGLVKYRSCTIGTKNIAPFAKAGNDLTVTAGAKNVQLDGSASYDPDGKIVHYEWWKIAGPKGKKIWVNRYQAKITLSRLTEGVYTFELTVKDDDGAIDKDSVKVKVVSTTLASNAVVNNGLSSLSKSAILNEDEPSIYPNPTDNILNVAIPPALNGKLMLNIYNAEGQLVQTKTIYKDALSSSETLDVHSLSSGMYALQIVSETDKKILKFIKK